MRHFIWLVNAVLFFASSCNDGKPCSIEFESNRPSVLSVNEFNQLIRDNDLASVRDVISRGFDVNAVSSFGANALFEPITLEMFEILVDHGINVNQQKPKEYGGETPLHVHSISGNFEIVEALLLSGADPKLVDINGYKPIDYAKKYSESDEEWAGSFKDLVQLLKGGEN